MYYRTSLAAVQDDSATDKNVSLSSKSAAYTPTERTIWAKVPLKTKHGRCVAVKLRGDVVLIGISVPRRFSGYRRKRYSPRPT